MQYFISILLAFLLCAGAYSEVHGVSPGIVRLAGLVSAMKRAQVSHHPIVSEVRRLRGGSEGNVSAVQNPSFEEAGHSSLKTATSSSMPANDKPSFQTPSPAQATAAPSAEMVSEKQNAPELEPDTKSEQDGQPSVPAASPAEATDASDDTVTGKQNAAESDVDSSGQHARYVAENCGQLFDKEDIEARLRDLGYSAAESQRLHRKHAQSIIAYGIPRPPAGVPKIWKRPKGIARMYPATTPTLLLTTLAAVGANIKASRVPPPPPAAPVIETSPGFSFSGLIEQYQAGTLTMPTPAQVMDGAFQMAQGSFQSVWFMVKPLFSIWLMASIFQGKNPLHALQNMFEGLKSRFR